MFMLFLKDNRCHYKASGPFRYAECLGKCHEDLATER